MFSCLQNECGISTPKYFNYLGELGTDVRWDFEVTQAEVQFQFAKYFPNDVVNIAYDYC
jgi:hypothetical protein